MSGLPVRFFVPGDPVPQGSKSPWGGEVNAKTLHPWRDAIRRHAEDLEPYDGPVAISLVFSFSRPKSHYLKSGLRETAPHYVTRTPDIDKLARAVLDALAGAAFINDSKVADLSAVKQYTEDRPGVSVSIAGLL